MATPNLLEVSIIKGKISAANVTTVATAIVENEAASGNIIKIASMSVSNIDTANTTAVDVYVSKNDVPYALIKQVNIPINTTVDVISRTTYLEEGDKLLVSAGANNHSQVVVSYEIIS